MLCYNTDDAAATKSDDLVVDRSYVKKKLEHGLTRIWQVRIVIKTLKWSGFSFDHLCMMASSPGTITACPLSAGRPVESEGLYPGNGHVEFQIR